MRVSIVLEGGAELQRKLDGLERKVSRQTIRNAIREAQKVMVEAAKISALTIVGGKMGSLIARSFALRAAKRRMARSSYSMHVLLKANPEFRYRTKVGREHYIPAAIEYGHGRNREQAARPFMRRASESSRSKVLSRFTEILRQGIEAVAKTG